MFYNTMSPGAVRPRISGSPIRQSWLRTLAAFAAVAASMRSSAARRIVPPSGQWRYPNSGRGPHQGRQEMARRRRQIAAGMLRRANGLDPL